MSLLGWFSGGWRRPRGRVASSSLPDSSGLSRLDATRPLKTGATTSHDGAPGRTAPPVDAGGRRSERLEQRERLYSVVRESMVRSGVLSSGYKFKVLSLDARGGQFMVMMDLARDLSREPARLSEIEVLIAQSARQRFDILVTAVYWRLNEHVVVSPAHARPMAAASAPLPALKPAAVVPAVALAHRADPLQAEEIAAFKQALEGAVGAARAQTAARLEAKAEAQLRAARGAKLVETSATPPRKGLGWPRRSPAQLTGYEDTEAFEPREHPQRTEPAQALSETQWGELH